LGIAQELSGSIQTLQNVPGSIVHLLRQTAAQYNAEYTLIDMSPSLGSINQNLPITSDFFHRPDKSRLFLCHGNRLVVAGASEIAGMVRQKPQVWEYFKRLTYPFPPPTLTFLGTIIQKYRPRGGEPAKGFQAWIERINEVVAFEAGPNFGAKIRCCWQMLPIPLLTCNPISV
jgi:hypothetical protein